MYLCLRPPNVMKKSKIFKDSKLVWQYALCWWLWLLDENEEKQNLKVLQEKSLLPTVTETSYECP
jgi:hypothetical protein